NPKISKPNAGRLFILDLRMRRQAVGDRPAVVDEKLKDFQAPADEFNSDVHGIDCECTQTYRKPYVYAFRPWGRTETHAAALTCCDRASCVILSVTNSAWDKHDMAGAPR